MGHDRRRHAALQVPQQPAAPVRSQHDQARIVLVGRLDDALNVGAASTAMLSARKPAFAASDAPRAVVFSSATRTSVA